MRRVPPSVGHVPSHARPWATFGPLVIAAVAGCGGDPPVKFSSVSEPPTVTLVRPEQRTIVRAVGQPSFVDSYEQTSIYPKLTGYVEKWNVDIGDRVKKNDVLATLFVPETVEDYRTKKADVEVARVLIRQSLKMSEVARAEVDAAKAHVDESKSNLDRYVAEVARWASEAERLKTEVGRGVVSPQILLESTNQLKSNIAMRDAAKSTIVKATADEIAREADAGKAQVDVELAKARLAVAESDAKRLEAWVGYLTLTAPFDGVIAARNVNTGDFVMPASGDPSAAPRSPDQSAARATPLYVVDRLDIVRIFVDVPEQDADYVNIGTKATVLVRAYRDQEIPASVTRTSWALNVKSRTLRAEVDLPNTDARILPGMYAYGKVIIDRPGVRALPVDALVYSGEQTLCWLHKDGKSVRTEIETGVSDDHWIEVTNRRLPTSQANSTASAPWIPFDGTEEVILGDLSILTEDMPVTVATKSTPAKSPSPTAGAGNPPMASSR